MRSLYLLILTLFITGNSLAQIYPVSIDSRIENSATIAIAKLKDKHSYWDQFQTNIYTLNVMEVTAYLKGPRSQTKIAIITEGGVVGDRAQKNYPETNLQPNTEYMVFLIEEDFEVDDKIYRSLNPNTIQCKAVARIQGALPLQDGKYHDVFAENPFSEEELLNKIRRLTGLDGVRPDGSLFTARQFDDLNENNERLVVNITSIEDGDMNSGPFYAGTIDTGKELVINGSGFEMTRGTGKVEFYNADDGGSTWVEVSNTSDYVSWSDTEIRVKIDANAGTGFVRVTNSSSSSDTEAITIDWAMICVNSSFYLWGTPHRNRVELVDTNMAGGYYFEYSTVGGFSTNTDAKNAFERALTTWRCDSGVNFDIGTNGTTAGLVDDDTSSVMFTSLSGSTLGVASSRYKAIATITPPCDSADTFWHVYEVDVRFDNSGTTWWYGSGACPGGAYDFESVALHEQGHAHGMGHIIASTKVMHYSIGTCDVRRTLHATESAAAAHKMGHSTATNCVTSPSPMTAVPGGSCSLLPVELIAFDGRLKEKNVVLNWQSATEINNDFYTLERSLDGRNFEEIAIIKGQGTTYESQNYEYIDENPSFGVNYYRLTQTDFDGTFEVFDKIVAVNYISDIKVDVRPNPVEQDHFQLVYNSNQSGNLNVQVFDITGKLLQQENFHARKELNYFDISVDDLSNGIYILRTNLNNFVENIRFVKTN